MVFGIDFDNTISTHNYPFVGELVPMAKEVINTLKDNGHYIFLWTVRGDESWDSEGKINALQNAREFLDENEIEIDGFNSSPIHPSSSPKQHCDYFIDDINKALHLMELLKTYYIKNNLMKDDGDIIDLINEI